MEICRAIDLWQNAFVLSLINMASVSHGQGVAQNILTFDIFKTSVNYCNFTFRLARVIFKVF